MQYAATWANRFKSLMPHWREPCFLCGELTDARTLCCGCRESLPHHRAPACPQCALPTSDGETCGRCLRKPPRFDRTVAALAYEFPADVMIGRLKYSNALALAPLLAELLAVRLADERVDLILPTPLSKARLRERGFNQAAEIGRRVGRNLGVEFAVDGCRKIRDSAPQVSLPWDERARNVLGAFACDLDLCGQRVALVDDVMTTGATLNELARAVRARGAAHVSAWVVARTLPENLQFP